MTLNHEVRDILERQAEERLVTIICDQQTLDHPYARVSVTHLKRLLLNIAGNAVKYNRRGGYVRLVCREVEPADGVPVYEYTIADNGIGMSEEFQQRLYERFAVRSNRWKALHRELAWARLSQNSWSSLWAEP